jgi:hypothetical protein
MVLRSTSIPVAVFGQIAGRTNSRISGAIAAFRTANRGYSTAGTAIATRSPAVFDNPVIERLKDELTLTQPCFGVRGDEVEVLYEPAAFHQKLLVSLSASMKGECAKLSVMTAHDTECQTANHDIHAVYWR